jgi:putative transposase
MAKFRDRCRIESTRLPGWDYAQAGWYFVTLCTKDRAPFFGQVHGDDMLLSPIGEIVVEEWQRTPDIRANVTLDEWVIMPNHVHGILVIENLPHDAETIGPETPNGKTRRGPAARLQPGSLGAIIGQIKSVSTKRIRAAGFTHFAWQARYYDHIIRNQESLESIRHYIATNPAKWADDRYHVR